MDRSKKEKIFLLLKSLTKEKWSPYVVGSCIGLLALGSVVFFHKILGTSTTFVKLSALFWAVVKPSHFQNNTYYQQYLNHKPWIDWQFMLVIGIFIGAYLSRKISRSQIRVSELPTAPLTSKGPFASYIGGIILMFGARLAGGCTSAHAISGGFQLAVSGWLFMIGAFAVGIPTAWILYRKQKSENG